MTSYYSHAATILPVHHVPELISFYRDKLGFELTFQWGDPVDYAVLKAADVSIHLTRRADNSAPSKAHVALMVFTTDVDGLYQELVKKGVAIKTEIGDRDYGMRDFDIIDPEEIQIVNSVRWRILLCLAALREAFPLRFKRLITTAGST